MGMLAYLVSQLCPAILGGAALLGGWFWHSARVSQAERRGEERAVQQQERANLRKREEMAAVPKLSADETIERLRKGEG